MKKISIIILMALIIPLISANGLKIIGDNPISINKTYGTPYNINLTIQNQESFDFVNISFENNNQIQMPIINNLPSGQSVNLTATIISNTPFNGPIRLKGSYLSNVGQQFLTYNISVDFNNGLSECEKTIIKGDTIIWENLVSDPIEIWSPLTLWSNNNILQGETGSHTFDTPMDFTYYFTRYMYQFTNTCTIHVLDDQGYINDPQLDDVFNLNIGINYPGTNITVSIPEFVYNVSAFSSTDGILSITNTGDEIAKSVHLDGEWFSFNDNDFDIDIGASKGIVYTIKPIITSTNESAKTYLKTLSIKGNFDDYMKDFSIYVPYMEISDSTGTVLPIIELLNQYCLDNPNEQICNSGTQVVVGNETNDDFNVTLSASQVDGIWKYLFSKGDADKEFQNYVKELMDDYQNNVTSMSESMDAMKEDLSISKENTKKVSDGLIMLFIFICLFIALFITYKILEIKKSNENYNQLGLFKPKKEQDD